MEGTLTEKVRSTGIRDRHRGLLLLTAGAAVGYLLFDAYLTSKRQKAEEDARRKAEDESRSRSVRYKIGVDPDAVELLSHVRGNDHYIRGTTMPRCPPDITVPGSGVFSGRRDGPDYERYPDPDY